jgi:hypothetical protein
MKSETGVSSTSGIKTAEGCDGLGMISCSTIWNSSSSKNFGLASYVRVACEILRRSFVPFAVEICRNDPCEAKLRYSEVFYLDPYKNVEEEQGLVWIGLDQNGQDCQNVPRQQLETHLLLA